MLNNINSSELFKQPIGESDLRKALSSLKLTLTNPEDDNPEDENVAITMLNGDLKNSGLL